MPSRPHDKSLNSRYQPAARNGAWFKAKHPHARDLQVDRSTWSPRERAPIDTMLISYH